MNPQDPNGGLPPNSQQPSYGPNPAVPPQSSPQPYPQAPTQPYQANGPALPQDQYAFIMQSGQKPKANLLGGLTSGSLVKRIGLIGAAVVILFILIIVAASVLGGGKSNTTPLVSVAQDQTELIRIAKMGTTSATTQSVRDAAFNAKLSLTSTQQQLLDYLKNGQHQKISTKELGLKQNAQTTTTLTNALATSTFDSAFTTSMKSLLTTYSQDLRTAYKANPGPKGRALLNKEFTGAQLLLQQTTQASSGAS